MTTGNLLKTFTPPEAAGPVVALGVYGGASNSPVMLVVGHASSGTLYHYNLESGDFLLTLETLPGLTALLPLRRFGALATVHAGVNRLVVSDLATDQTPQVSD